MSYEYPKITNEFFQRELYNKKEYLDYQTYENNVKNKISFFPKDYSLFPHQIFVKHFMSPTTPYRNLLLFHSTGSGKTCSTIQITEQYKDQILKYKNKTYIITSERLSRVFKEELINKSCIRGTYSSDVINKQSSEYTRYYEFITFAKFYKKIDDMPKKEKNFETIYNEMKSVYSNRLIVVDEFQNYKSIKSDIEDKDKDKDKGKKINKVKKNSVSFRNTFLKMLLISENSKLLLLSATPIVDGVDDLRFIINAFHALTMTTEYKDGKIICKGNPIYLSNTNYFDDFHYKEIGKKFPTDKDFKTKYYNNDELNINEIEKTLRGQISYIQKSFDIKINYDDGKKWKPFNDIYDFPYKIVPTIMSFKQKNGLTDLVKKGTHSWQLMSTIMPNYLLEDLEIADIGTDYDRRQFELSEEECKECINGIKSISSKFGTLMKYIKKAENKKEKVFVSTDLVSWMLEPPKINNQKLTIKPFLKHLLEANGYVEYTYEEFKGKKEYHKEKRYMVVTGDTNDSIDFINQTYNKKKNKYGEYIRILIGTSAINEGISFKSVRQTHLLFINNNYSLETVNQIFGRAVRGDSHDQFKDKKDRYTKRYIHVHTYNKHDLDINFKLDEFKKIQGEFLKYKIGEEEKTDKEEDTDKNEDSATDEEDNKKTNKYTLPSNELILNLDDTIKNIFDPQDKIKNEKDSDDASNILKIFDKFLNYEYSIFELFLNKTDEEIRDKIKETIKDEESFIKYKKKLFIILIHKYKSNVYYPYDLYSYLIAFTKYIKNMKIVNIFIQIAVDCNLNKQSNNNQLKCIPDLNKVKIEEIDMSTYKHEHNISKLEYITDSIKNLFGKKEYYTFDELVNYFIKIQDSNINLPTYIEVSEVPDLINLALKEMVPSDNIDITIFKHKIIYNNDLGYIIKKGNIITFQKAISIKLANDKYESLLKKEEYLTDIFTNIKYGDIDKNLKYQTIEDYYEEHKTIPSTEIELMTKEKYDDKKEDKKEDDDDDNDDSSESDSD